MTTEKKSAEILPVVLCGGSGTRLWPMSREHHPKQFQEITGGQTLYQQTLKRIGGLPGMQPPLVMTNTEHRFLAAEQAREAGLPVQAILLEPVARNTAPAIALAALWAMSTVGDRLLLVCPADHVIGNEEAFQEAVVHAAGAAAAGALVTFGIVPTRPETGYGYIQRGELLHEAVYRVERFVEKPDVATAATFLADGRYSWNSGMFLFRASAYLAALQRYRPDIHAACADAFSAVFRDLDFVRVPAEEFKKCLSESIDYAVMEKTDRAVVVPFDPAWSDVGAWAAVWEVRTKDADGNVLDGDVYALECTNSYVRSGKLTALIGLDNVVVVDTPDALLVADQSRAQEVKQIVAMLARQGRSETEAHRKVCRPWGSYDSVDCGERFQVKRIIVKPGAALSLQMHHHRAEHWIVVRGTARITRGGETFLLSENQSTYIPVGERHRLENPGKVPLEMIEVQSGSYLGEDDIVRFDDVYGRNGSVS